ncbi:hypothetical protein PhaeoP83_01743 [Phaeobacter inhibens]|uniref:hypothetical protein n=1 Tax=Phaeobacter inhibens TaxID=221822 RepID=UPI000CA177B7|nr:hypothetical protein [Phaeobacter inhibens]AUQ50016.1 hypothetical protein PhaeoP83_01743 [Phaeobacter inhibens]AUQ54256.1 hypothetical protein PhaeoP92_01575 [Phaeobacter inhibens]AUQ78272.1 hypothetical protein PhaeoP74_01576 [Phaeobacter inhibens]AUR15431.1 hypothetical protein PhaeoP70_01574 [Phaeobacter inhibens]AUR19821.1 hypothetical protein PhaeoP80_01743 [Phaeobacter inhibens]
MNTAEMIQTVLGLVAVGGIGGVWFRLGSLTAKTDHLESRVTRLEQHQQRSLIA